MIDEHTRPNQLIFRAGAQGPHCPYLSSMCLGPCFGTNQRGSHSRPGHGQRDPVHAKHFIQHLPTPHTMYLLETENTKKKLACLATYSKEMNSQEGQATTYVCQGQRCERPVTSSREMLDLLKS